MKKKLIIVILVAVLLAGAGTVGVYHHNQVQKAKAIAVEKAKEEKEKDARFKKLQSEYDTAEMQTENSLYPNADETVPDDATMNSSRDGKKKELVAFQEKIRNKKMTKKEETDFHTFVSSVKDIYKASQTTVDTLHTEVAGIDPNQYGTYYTDANKTDTEKNLSAYDKDYKDGKYRDAYTDLTNVKTIYASADTAKKQAEEQAAKASKQAEEQAAQAKQSAQKSANNSTGNTKKQRNTAPKQNNQETTQQTAPSAQSAQPQTQADTQEDDDTVKYPDPWNTPGARAAQAYVNEHGGTIKAYKFSTGGGYHYSYFIHDTNDNSTNVAFHADGSMF